MTGAPAPTNGPRFLTRIRDVAVPYMPYVTKASSMIYGKNKLVDETLDTTLSKMEQLSTLTMEKVHTHVPSEVINHLDTFGCAQLDRLQILSTQSNAAIKTTYAWCKETSNKAGDVVKTTLNTTADRILPDGNEATASTSVAQNSQPLTLAAIATKVITRAKPIVESRITQSLASYAELKANIPVYSKTAVAYVSQSNTYVDAQIKALGLAPAVHELGNMTSTAMEKIKVSTQWAYARFFAQPYATISGPLHPSVARWEHIVPSVAGWVKADKSNANTKQSQQAAPKAVASALDAALGA